MCDYPEGKFADRDCEDCEGKGRIYNNADETCGQWVECECVSKKAMVNVSALIQRLIKQMNDDPETKVSQSLPWKYIYATIMSSEKSYPSKSKDEL